MNDWTLVFGYQHVTGIPPCPTCRAEGEPGNYMLMERATDDPLRFRLRCWCGATLGGNFDTESERAEFLARNGINHAH